MKKKRRNPGDAIENAGSEYKKEIREKVLICKKF